jgi:4-amino-4-deoxy-L-arabinose transferase-like glycosyltransferase
MATRKQVSWAIMFLNRFVASIRENRTAAWVLFAIVLLRLVSFGWLAVADPTESRYAEIAKHMYESNDWVTPRLYIHGELIPYWGKPPLHFWLTSVCFKIFGVSEWASRLPSILAGMALLICVYVFASRLWSARVAWLSTMILASSGLFFVLWGASVVDVTLSAAVTLAMISFPFAWIQTTKRKKHLFGLLFFIGLALATLTKGLVAPGIAVVSIGLWWLLNGRPSLRNLPWISGIATYLVITVPWFILQEARTPGFLKYFIVNEHLLRFLTHDYGDKYGSGHIYPRGTIWIMLIVMYLPWTFFIAGAAIKRWKKRDSVGHQTDKAIWLEYVCIWGVTPAIFFTLSRQILGTYLLPGFAGLAIATAVALCNWSDWLKRAQFRRLIYSIALAVPAVIAAATFLFGSYFDETNSIKPLFAKLAAAHSSGTQVIVFPFYEPPSADFYESRYKTLSIYRSKQPMDQLPMQGNQLVVLRTKQWSNLPPEVQKNLELLETCGVWAIYKQGVPQS